MALWDAGRRLPTRGGPFGRLWASAPGPGPPPHPGVRPASSAASPSHFLLPARLPEASSSRGSRRRRRRAPPGAGNGRLAPPAWAPALSGSDPCIRYFARKTKISLGRPCQLPGPLQRSCCLCEDGRDRSCPTSAFSSSPRTRRFTGESPPGVRRPGSVPCPVAAAASSRGVGDTRGGAALCSRLYSSCQGAGIAVSFHQRGSVWNQTRGASMRNIVPKLTTVWF